MKDETIECDPGGGLVCCPSPSQKDNDEAFRSFWPIQQYVYEGTSCEGHASFSDLQGMPWATTCMLFQVLQDPRPSARTARRTRRTVRQRLEDAALRAAFRTTYRGGNFDLLETISLSQYGLNNYMAEWNTQEIELLRAAGFVTVHHNRACGMGDVDSTSATVTPGGTAALVKFRERVKASTEKAKARAARILAAQADGLELPAAIDRVLGEGSYAEIVSDLYDALCVKAKATEG